MLLLRDIIELGMTLLFEDWSLATHNSLFPWANVTQEGPRKEHQGRRVVLFSGLAIDLSRTQGKEPERVGPSGLSLAENYIPWA